MDIPSHLKGKEIPLNSIGLNEVAWEKDTALELLDYFRKAGAFVLGGDVLIKDSHKYRHNFDNWHFDQTDGNAEQSVEYTRHYIKNYPPGDYVFVLVVA